MEHLTVPGSHLYVVSKGEGFLDLRNLITSGRLLIRGYKVMVILLGRVDVLDWQSSINQKLQALVEAIHAREPGLAVCFATPPPWPQDSVRVTSKLFRAGAVIKAFCKGHGLLHFTRACADLTWRGGTNTMLINSLGLTKFGYLTVQRALANKICTGELRSVVQWGM